MCVPEGPNRNVYPLEKVVVVYPVNLRRLERKGSQEHSRDRQ